MADHKSSAYFNSLGAFLSLRIVVFSNLRVNGDVLGGQCVGRKGGDKIHMNAFDQEHKDPVWIRDATVLSASQSPTFPSKPLPGVTLHVHSQSHRRDWHHEARVFRSCLHICFPLPHRGRERPPLCSVNRPYLGKRWGVNLPFLYHLGARKRHICAFHQSNTQPLYFRSIAF